MELVEILARELEEWPDEACCVTQDGGKDVCSWGKPGAVFEKYAWYSPMGIDCELEMLNCYPDALATDHATAIITREMWEAERAKLKEDKTVKANKDGWIWHRGGKCPVEAGTLIDIRCRDGQVREGVVCGEEFTRTADMYWRHDGDKAEVMAYRLHKPKREEIVGKLQDECEAVVALGNSLAQAGPLQWRDRIHEIDASRKEEEARHCAAMEAFDKERDELVAKLAAEGLALVEREEVAAAEDMSDWRNWRVGDLVVLLTSYGPNAKEGQIMVVSKFDTESPIQIQPVRITPIDDASAGWWPAPEKMRWHSRPTA